MSALPAGDRVAASWIVVKFAPRLFLQPTGATASDGCHREAPE